MSKMPSCSNKGSSGHDKGKTVGIVRGYGKGRCLLSSDMFLVGGSWAGITVLNQNALLFLISVL